MKILVTGAAGFIGQAVCIKLLNDGNNILGIDNLNSYYDKKLKLDRLSFIDKNICKSNKGWQFRKCDLKDSILLEKIFNDFRPNIVVNLGRQLLFWLQLLRGVWREDFNWFGALLR